ncbi:PadR family transcriptional regulator [bacterium]|jgi:PadR family transcriptional regulator, regulatory protein PadR|nr:PadR family transcriptional regulator [Planctomicrobium sp.]MDB4802605.1 PadR family transcriptional regulator [bacterium]
MNMFIKGNQVRGHLETMVLSVLESEESHGFDIVKRLEAAGDGSLNLKEGTVYPVLYRLEDAKLLKAKWEENDSGRKGPRRKVYSLTAKGRKQLEAGRNEWKAFVNVVGGIVGGLS